MSELKARRAYFSEDEYDRGAHKICAKVSDCGYDRRNDWWSYAFEDEVYLKSEADKVIAEKDAEIARLKDRRLDVKDVAHVLKAFKFYLCQLTHCAYDERTAQWIIDNWYTDYKRVEGMT